MRVVFGVGEAAVADLQHVRVVPVSRAGVGRQRSLDVDDAGDVAPGRFDVRADPPHVGDAGQIETTRRGVRTGRHAGAAGVRVDAVDDGAAGRAKCIAHGRERALWATAIVVFEQIHTPRSVGLRVLRLVAEASHEHGRFRRLAVEPFARARVGCRIDAELEPLVVHVAGEPCDARGKPRGVPANGAGGIPAVHPAIVDVHVLVADVLHPAADQSIGGGFDARFVDVARERVPRVPAHGRRGRDDAGIGVGAACAER